MKPTYTYKDCASRYSVQLLNSFDFEVKLKDTKSAIKNKLITLLPELRGFKFVRKLFLEFKKIEKDQKRINSTFYSNSEAEAIIN